MEPRSGELVFTNQIDYDTEQRVYLLNVSADDSVHATYITVRVEVLDTNDIRPEFTNLPANVELAENAMNGDLVFQVSATDEDVGVNGRITFALLCNGDGRFTIDGRSGRIYVNGSDKFDYDGNNKTYVLEIMATDNAGLDVSGSASGEGPNVDLNDTMLSDNSTLTIILTDINDNEPIFTEDPYDVSVFENVDSTTVVVRVVATDADDGSNEMVTYNITDGDEDKFVINEATGVITAVPPLDFENQTVYTLSVVAVDMGDEMLSGTTTVIIRVLDSNDNVPQFVNDPYTATVTEHSVQGTLVIQVSAMDVDTNEILTYYFPESNMYFSINNVTGDIFTTSSPIDREANEFFTITVRVNDTDGLFDTTAVRIIIEDINDNSPVFTRTFYRISIDETYASGREVETISANDADANENGQIRFSLEPRNAHAMQNDRFTIDSITGRVSIKNLGKGPLCFNDSSYEIYDYAIIASDRGTISHSTTTILHITVNIGNAYTPQFVRSPFIGRLQVEAPIGAIAVGFLEATDDDQCNEGFQFGIEGNRSEYFNINSVTGQITLARNLGENDVSFDFTITVADVGHPSTEVRSSTGRVVILVGQLLPIRSLVSSPGLVVPPLKQSSPLGYEQDIWFYNGGSSSNQPNISISLGTFSEQVSVNVVQAPGTRVRPVLVTQSVSYDRPEVVVFAQVMSDSYDTVHVGPTSMEVELINNETGSKATAACTTEPPHSTCSVVATVPDSWFNTPTTINVTYGLGSAVKYSLGMVEGNTRPTDCSSSITEHILVILPSSVQFTNTTFNIDVYAHSIQPIRTFLLRCAVEDGFTVESVCSKGELTMQASSFEQELNILGHSSGILPTQTGLQCLFQATVRINANTVIPESGVLSFTCTVDYMSDIYSNRILANTPAIHAGGSDSTCTQTEGSIRIAVNSLLEIFPYATESSIINTAALDMTRISSSVTVVGVYSSGHVNHQLPGAYCVSSSSAIQVMPDCSEVYLDGSETSGGNPTRIQVSMGDVQQDLLLLVWYPTLVELYFSDTELSAISGFNGPSCESTTYQETIFRVQATFEADNLRQDAIITSLIGEDDIHYGSNSNILDIMSINELEQKAIARETGTTTVQVQLPSGINSPEVSIVVTDNSVNVNELGFALRTALTSTITNPVSGVNYVQPVQISTHYNPNYHGAKVEVLVEAVFDDGRRQTITPALGLNLTSLDTSVFHVSGTTMDIFGSGSGNILQGEWVSECQTPAVVSAMEYVSIDLLIPTSISLMPENKILLSVDNVASRIGIPQTVNIKAYLNYDDGVTTDITTDSSLEYNISNDSIISVDNGIISALGITESSTIEAIYDIVSTDNDTLNSNTVEVEVVSIEEIRVEAVPYPPYPSSESIDARSRRPFRSSYSDPDAVRYQQAMIIVTAVLSNGDEIDITDHENTQLTVNRNILEINDNIVEPISSGMADVTASITGTSLGASLTFRISNDVVRIRDFSSIKALFTNGTLRGIAGSPIVCMYTDIAIEFEDNSTLHLLDSVGSPIYPGLLSFSSSDTSSITIDEQNGSMTILNNSPRQVDLTITAPDGTSCVTSLWANLDPALGDIDIGSEIGFPLSMESSPTVLVPIYINSEGRTIGASEIEIVFNNDSVVFSGGDVMVGSDWPNGTFFSTSTDFNNKVAFGGISTSPVKGTNRMHIATLEFIVTGDMDDIYFEPRIITLTEMGLNPATIGDPTPRRSQAGRVAFSDNAEIQNDAVGFTPPTYCSMPHSTDIDGDGVFDLRYVVYTQIYATLQSSMSPEAAQIEAMDANKDGLVTASDVEFLSRAHFGLLRFVASLDLTPIDEAGSDCVMTLNITLVDRYNCPATTSNTDIYFMLISTNPTFETQFRDTVLVSGERVNAMPIPNNTYGVWLRPEYLNNGVFGIQTKPNNITQTNLGFSIAFATKSTSSTQQPRDVAMIGDNAPPYTYPAIDIVVDSINITLPYGFNPLRALNNSFASALCYNDYSPVFGADIYGLPSGYSESTPVGMVIVDNIEATDDDAPRMSGDIRFSISSSTAMEDMFAINPDTGVVTLIRSLDRESYADVRVVIFAIDQGPHIPSRRTASATLVVVINDVNDNAPQFEQAMYEVDVTETDGDNTAVDINPFVTVSATDRDINSENNQVTYRIVNGDNSNPYFEIDSSGGVSHQRHLDRETQNFFNLTITATDNGSPSLSSTTYLAINVIDVNDNRLEIYVFENVDPPINVFTVSATDADEGSNAEFTFRIAGVFLADDNGVRISGTNIGQDYFSINETTGEFSVLRELDREGNYSFEVNIRTVEMGVDESEFALQFAHVRVCDVNDNAPVFSQQHYYINVSESVLPDQPIIQITATDVDGSAFCGTEDAINQQDNVIRYSLLNAEYTPFNIDSVTAELSLNQSLDFEVRNQYTFTIQAVDLGVPPLNATADVTVNVNDSNDVPPMFNDSTYLGGIQENAPIRTEVHVQPFIAAYDIDTGEGGMFWFSLSGVGHTDFSIDPDSGIIVTVRNIDRERRPEYNLMIIATDNGNPPLFSMVPLHITLHVINDNAPHFTEDRYSFRVSENTPVVTQLFRLLLLTLMNQNNQ